MVERVIVFLDWQNVYMRARESFHDPGDPFTDGQVNPLDLARLLASRGLEDERELMQVRVYRGIPDQKYDPKAYAAARRQMSSWSLNRKVEVVTRVLRYPSGWPDCDDSPREKGVDVSLAVDLVTMAIAGDFDTGIVMSSDQDIAPAVEYVATNHQLPARVEVAAWKGGNGRRPNRINTSARVYGHWLRDQDYWGLIDETDYTRAQDAPTGPVPRPPSRF